MPNFVRVELKKLCPNCREMIVKGLPVPRKRGPKGFDRGPILAALAAGNPPADIAARLNCSLKTVVRVRAKRRAAFIPNVVFVDGRVEYLDPEALKTALAETKRRLEQQP